MNIQEFAEWLRKECRAWIEQSDADFEAGRVYQEGYANGYASALEVVLHRLTTLDSSHDLPSTKG